MAILRVKTLRDVVLLLSATLIPLIIFWETRLTLLNGPVVPEKQSRELRFNWNSSSHSFSFNRSKKQRLVIIGAGPTGLGAAYRLFEQGILRTSTQVVILEQQHKPGGLAVSQRDNNGFLWDMGGHVVFSHYKYFDKLLREIIPHWNEHKRAAFAFMKGSSGKRNFIPYPVQDNILMMDGKEQQLILKDLQQLRNHATTRQPANFDEWLLKNFGEALSNVFMRNYNRKVWTVDPKDMNAVWVGERVAVPNITEMKRRRSQSEDSQWGPNRLFRFPRYNGTGGIWKAVSNLIPRGWFHFKHNVIGIDIENKKLTIVVDGKETYSLEYDILINTAPLDVLVNMDKSDYYIQKKKLVNDLVYSHTHVIGIGLKGQPPEHLSSKSWIYFPDSDSPFYRVTVFSKYSDDHVPQPRVHWSLMCEAAEPKVSTNNKKWTKENILLDTIAALVRYGFISKDQVVSQYHHRLDHGYPVPSTSRERILSIVQPWLESHRVYSRGRFGGWRYEVSNQDHSLMQGLEIADFILKGIPEETYTNPKLVNSMKGSDRSNKEFISLVPDYEVVVSHYDEDLGWLLNEAIHSHIYHKGKRIIHDFNFKQWETVPNVGRESHTYLYHIITHYNRLADVTVFVQGNPKEHNKFCYNDIQKYVAEARNQGYSVKYRLTLETWGRLNHVGKFRQSLKTGLLRENRFGVGEFWENAFGSPHPEKIQWCPSSCFAITREIIHKKSIEFYKKLIRYVDDHPNPEEGHYFERLWHGVFFGN